MHFSIPDTAEINDGNGSSFTVFNLNINGVYHCSLRYRQLHSFHEQLKKGYGAVVLPTFPPKKLLSLTPAQLEERRLLLERYIQIISQNQEIAASETFNGFLLSAQQASQRAEPEDVTLDVYLMNGHKITLSILSTDQTDDVLESLSSQIELQDDFVYYFGLFLIKKEEGSENAIVRKLQEFESPFISLRAANQMGIHRIVLRKCFWDSAFDDELLDDRIAMNLAYVQAVNDVERGWVIANKEQHKQLAALQQKGSKKEYMRLVRTLKYYGFIQFKPCTVDYPNQGCRTIVAAGNRELNFRIQATPEQVVEKSFKVTRMRCWRITTTMLEANGEASLTTTPNKLELAFEYLVAKDVLKWITITSEQAILMSMCLQGMVDELIMKKQGKRMKRPSDRARGSNSSTTRSPLSRDTSSTSLKSPSTPTEIPIVTRPPQNILHRDRETRMVAASSSSSSSSTASRAVSHVSHASSVLTSIRNGMIFKVNTRIYDNGLSCSEMGDAEEMSTQRLSETWAFRDSDGASSGGSTLSLTHPLSRMNNWSCSEEASGQQDAQVPSVLGRGHHIETTLRPQRGQCFDSNTPKGTRPRSSRRNHGIPSSTLRHPGRGDFTGSEESSTENALSSGGSQRRPFRRERGHLARLLSTVKRIETKVDNIQWTLDVYRGQTLAAIDGQRDLWPLSTRVTSTFTNGAESFTGSSDGSESSLASFYSTI